MSAVKQSSDFDVVVIGAGIQGSSTAYTLSKSGKNVLLLEQFPLPHTRGSSHGQSRIIRKTYEEDHFAEMMQEAYRLWAEIEKDSNTELYVKTGMLAFGPPTDSYLKGAERAFIKWGYPYTKFTNKEFAEAYPQINVPENYIAILDHDAGILRADKCLKAIQQLFVQNGGTLKDGVAVSGIRPGNTIHVSTSKGVYRCKQLVITAGPWTSKLLKPLGLHLPLQVCLHSGTDIDDPEDRDLIQNGDDVAKTCDFVDKVFPGLENKPSIIERCMYTVTPDNSFVLDVHPRWNNIIIGAGFSGTGFKLGPVVGKILTDLTLKRPAKYDLSPFKISRFLNTTVPKSQI
ncbi:unnamed protein product [Owenia fusiformis]|uniref:sarcosine oxidasee (formaldehyde-forming) n=1 Tax=Owenia fusiformis TaxID=6347 RepID=A0A8J1TKE1_OWEFU|nr:unnamed protein product [Owenia fusiformis]